MKKQGPPPPLDESRVTALKKRKVTDSDNVGRSGNKRRAVEKNERETLYKKSNGTRSSTGKINAQGELQQKAETAKHPVKAPLPANDISDGDAADLLGDEFEGPDSGSDSSADESGGNELDPNEDGNDESDDSAFDSDPEPDQKAMFSEDEDDSDAEEKLTAANFEGLSRKLDTEKASAAVQAQLELEEAALQTNIDGDFPDNLLDGNEDDPTSTKSRPGLAPDLQLLRSRITETIRILGDFSTLAEPTKSRTDYTTLLLSDICTYYGYTPYLAEKLLSLFPPLEAFAFFEANESPRPVVIRTNTLRTNRRTLAQALISRGMVLEPVGKWSKVGLQVFESAVPIGATPEYLAGHYILQAASSFLPVMALAPQSHERILDMAAAPGGKTTYISALMRNTGCVLANDANRVRAKGLIGNIHRLGCKNTIVSNLDARESFPKVLGGFDRVLLDAPCSGTGVIAKDPCVKTSKTARDFLALPHMQKQLLLAAIDSTDHASKTGGYVVYSTCSVTVEENEGVVQYVLRKRPNVKIVDTGLGTFGSDGFKRYMCKVFDEKMGLARRYFPHRENVDGFFVCKLRVTGPTLRAALGSSQTVNGNGVLKKDAATVEMDIGVAKVSITDSLATAQVGDDDFGGFDDEEDEKYIARGQRNRLRKKGLNPKAALNRNARKGRKG